MVIVIEGLDGSGKETLVRNLKTRIERTSSKNVGVIAFPSYEDIGPLNVSAYLNGELGNKEDIHPKLTSCLYLNDRLNALPKLKKIISENNVVIIDRYVGSNMYHQGALLKSSKEMTKEDQLFESSQYLKKLEHDIYGIPVPDIIVWIDNGIDGTPTNLRMNTDDLSDILEKDLTYKKSAYNALRIVAHQQGWIKVQLFDEITGKPRTETEITDEVIGIMSEFHINNTHGR